jgi:myosin-5
MERRVWVPCEREVWRLAQVLTSDEQGRPARVAPLDGSAPFECAPTMDGPHEANDGDGADDDLVQLQHLDAPSILHAVCTRFARGQIYTYVGPILISLNPWIQLEHLYAPETQERYVRADERFGEAVAPPHVYAIADRAYARMRREAEPQSILVSGESGAGKTECTKLILQHLTCVSGSASSGELELKLLESTPLLEAFGNARTLRNHNSSRFGKLITIGFDRATGRVSGCEVHTYLLEKSRVPCQDAGEQNYHAFYVLLGGAEALEAAGLVGPLGLDPAADYPYASLDALRRAAEPAAGGGAKGRGGSGRGRGGGGGGGGNGSLRGGSAPLGAAAARAFGGFGGGGSAWVSGSSTDVISPRRRGLPADARADAPAGADALALARLMGELGMTPVEINSALTLVGALLHLGAVVLEPGSAAADGDPAAAVAPGSERALADASRLLRVGEAELRAALCCRTLVTVEGDMTIPNSAEQAREARDAFAKALYNSLFRRVVGAINAGLGGSAAERAAVAAERAAAAMATPRGAFATPRRASAASARSPGASREGAPRESALAASFRASASWSSAAAGGGATPRTPAASADAELGSPAAPAAPAATTPLATASPATAETAATRESPEVQLISVLDIFGFEYAERNSFEQLCINYANEKLQRLFNAVVFEAEQAAYGVEGLPWQALPYTDNAATLALLEARPLGVFSLLDEECVVPRGTDGGFARKLAAAHASHQAFRAPALARAEGFVVVHFAAAVHYSVHGFLDKNRDSLPADLLALAARSADALVRSVAESAAAPAQPATAASSSAARRSAAAKPAGARADTLGSQFKAQLSDLTAACARTHCHFVRCVNPNSAKRAANVERARVTQQLQCSGVIDAVRVMRAAFPSRMAHAAFASRFRTLAVARARAAGDGAAAAACAAGAADLHAAVCTALGAAAAAGGEQAPLAPGGWLAGTTKMFFTAQQLHALERARARAFATAAVDVQAAVRANAGRARFAALRGAARVVQAAARAYDARRAARAAHVAAAAARLGRAARRLLARGGFRRLRAGARALQATWRGRRARLAAAQELRLASTAVRLQCAWRALRARRSLRRLRAEARSVGKARKERDWALAQLALARDKAEQAAKAVAKLSHERAILLGQWSAADAQLAAVLDAAAADAAHARHARAQLLAARARIYALGASHALALRAARATADARVAEVEDAAAARLGAAADKADALAAARAEERAAAAAATAALEAAAAEAAETHAAQLAALAVERALAQAGDDALATTRAQAAEGARALRESEANRRRLSSHLLHAWCAPRLAASCERARARERGERGERARAHRNASHRTPARIGATLATLAITLTLTLTRIHLIPRMPAAVHTTTALPTATLLPPPSPPQAGARRVGRRRGRAAHDATRLPRAARAADARARGQRDRLLLRRRRRVGPAPAAAAAPPAYRGRARRRTEVCARAAAARHGHRRTRRARRRAARGAGRRGRARQRARAPRQAPRRVRRRRRRRARYPRPRREHARRRPLDLAFAVREPTHALWPADPAAQGPHVGGGRDGREHGRARRRQGRREVRRASHHPPTLPHTHTPSQRMCGATASSRRALTLPPLPSRLRALFASPLVRACRAVEHRPSSSRARSSRRRRGSASLRSARRTTTSAEVTVTATEATTAATAATTTDDAERARSQTPNWP